MRSTKLFTALFLCASIEGMNKSQKLVPYDEHYKICSEALHKIYKLVDVYLESNKDERIEDLRLKEPLVQEWCKPTRHGLTLEILSKLHLTKNSVRYSIRSPWGLSPLIESKNRHENLPTVLFPDLQVTNFSKATLLYEESSQPRNQHITLWEKEKWTIVQIAHIAIHPAQEEYTNYSAPDA